MQLAVNEFHLYRDYGYSLVLDREFYRISWKALVKEVNEHNDAYVKGGKDYLLRVYCPWEGELYVSH